MKVLQLHNHYRQAGGEDAVVERERALLESHGHRVIPVEANNTDLDRMAPLQRALLPFRALFSVESYKRVREICHRERPGVAHVHNVFFLLSPSVYYALQAEGVPIVQTCHNFRFLCANGLFFTENQLCERCKAGNYFHAVPHRCYRNSSAQSLMMAMTLAAHRYIGRWWNRIDAFIALSEFSRQKLLDGGLPADRLFLKPNFLDQPPAVEPAGDYAILMSRLQAEKGVNTVVDAFATLRDKRLMILGDGPLRAGLEAQARAAKPNRIEFCGFVAGEKRFELLRRSRLLVMPSLVYENFPTAVLEAYAAGKPVVASRIGATAELVEDGVTGLLFEPGNAADLADKLHMLLDDPARADEMGRNARQRYEQRYTPEENYRQLMNIYAFARRRRGLPEEAA